MGRQPVVSIRCTAALILGAALLLVLGCGSSSRRSSTDSAIGADSGPVDVGGTHDTNSIEDEPTELDASSDGELDDSDEADMLAESPDYWPLDTSTFPIRCQWSEQCKNDYKSYASCLRPQCSCEFSPYCTDDSECGPQQVCTHWRPSEPGCRQCPYVHYTCRTPCQSDDECPLNTACSAGHCVASTCASDFDCPDNYVCDMYDHKCRRFSCTNDDDCDTGFCVDGTCYEELGSCITPA